MCVGVSLGDRFRLAGASHDRLTLQRLTAWHLVLVACYLDTPIISSAYSGLGTYLLSVNWF